MAGNRSLYKRAGEDTDWDNKTWRNLHSNDGKIQQNPTHYRLNEALIILWEERRFECIKEEDEQRPKNPNQPQPTISMVQ